MEDSQEKQENLERELIKHQFEMWSQLIKDRGREGDTVDLYQQEYMFAIDRRDDEQSLFTADEITARTLKERLEEYIEKKEGLAPSAQDEKWINVTIKPEEPYRAEVAVLTQAGNEFYYTKQLEIFLSNLGRGHEGNTWSSIWTTSKDQQGLSTNLKKVPRAGLKRFTEDPSDLDLLTMEPLRGQTLERLNFILEQVRQGNIIE